MFQFYVHIFEGKFTPNHWLIILITLSPLNRSHIQVDMARVKRSAARRSEGEKDDGKIIIIFY